MKLLLNRRGHTEEKPMLICILLVVIFVLFKPNELEAKIMLISTPIIAIVAYIVYDKYLSSKIYKKSLLKYYNNKKYIIIDEDSKKEINEKYLDKYVNINSFKNIFTYKYSSRDKNIVKGFLFFYHQPVYGNSTYEYSKTLLIYKRSKYTLDKNSKEVHSNENTTK